MARALIVLLVAVVVSSTFANPTSRKVFTRCELVQWLRAHNAYMERTWTCIAFYESGYDTATIVPTLTRSFTHGLWQIHGYTWCDEGDGDLYNECGVSCEKLRDDDITDDWACVTLIDQIQGLTSWPSWPSCHDAENDPSWDEGC